MPQKAALTCVTMTRCLSGLPYPAGTTGGLILDGAVCPCASPIHSGGQHVLRDSVFVPQRLPALCGKAWPRLAVIRQDRCEELFLVPVSKAIEGQLVCVLGLAVVVLHTTANNGEGSAGKDYSV